MMGHREQLKGGDEYDYLRSRKCRRVHICRPGQVRTMKRRFNKRQRRVVRLLLKEAA